MSTLTGIIIRIGERLLRWRWGIIAFISLSIMVFEVVEHQVTTTLQALHTQFVFEVLVFSITFPVFVGVCLSIALRNQSLHQRLRRELEFHRSLNFALAGVQSWDDLARLLYQHLGLLLPINGLALLVYHGSLAAYQVVAACGEDLTSLRSLIPGVTNELCPIGVSDSTTSLTLCRCLDQSWDLSGRRVYCLPLFYEGFPLALILSLLPQTFDLKPEQSHLLAGAEWKIASTVECLYNTSIQSRHLSQVERINLRRSLNDRLDPPLSYLRFKLTEISEPENLQPGRLQHDLKLLRGVVDETYLEIRKALDKLIVDITPDLITNLQTCIAKIEARSDIRIRLVNEGQTLILPYSLQQQILYAFQETMENFEKQGRGHWIEVRLSRLPRGLIVSVTDHGSGYEFEEQEQPQVHLWFPIPHD